MDVEQQGFPEPLRVGQLSPDQLEPRSVGAGPATGAATPSTIGLEVVPVGVRGPVHVLQRKTTNPATTDLWRVSVRPLGAGGHTNVAMEQKGLSGPPISFSSRARDSGHISH